MISTDSSNRSETLDPSSAEFVVRFADDPTRSAVIGAEPITIGSGPRSDLRIESPGVKPLACVVSLRRDEVVARRWSNEVRLNDEEFQESAVRHGDQLTVGPVVLEFVFERGDDFTETSVASEETLCPIEGAPSTFLNETSDAQDLDAQTSDFLKFEEVDAEVAPAEDLDEPSGFFVSIEDDLPEQEESQERNSTVEAADSQDLWSIGAQEIEPDAKSSADPVDAESAVEEDADEPTADDGLWGIERASSLPAWSDELSESNTKSDDETDSLEAELSEEITQWAESVEPQPVIEDAVAEEDYLVSSTRAEELRLRLGNNRDRLRRLVASFRDERGEADRQATEAAGAIETLRTDLASTEQRCVELTTSNDTLREELAAAVARVELLEAEARDAVENIAPSESSEDGEPVGAPEEVSQTEQEFPAAPEAASAYESKEPGEPVWGIEESAESFEEEPATDTSVASSELWGVGADEFEAPADSEQLEAIEDEQIEQEEAAQVESEEAPVSFDDQPAVAEEVGGAGPAIADSNDEPKSGLWGIESIATDEEQIEEQDPTPDTYEEPESFYDRYAHLLPDDNSEQQGAEPIAPATPTAIDPQPEVGADDEDESIDDYLKQMMSRIRGDNGLAAAAPAPVVAQPITVKNEPEVAEAVGEPAEEPASEPLIGLDELSPREAPESGADMGSLRQLANQSARKAFVTADANQTKEQAQRQFIIALFAFCCGGLAIFTAPALLDWRMLIGVAGVLIGGYLGLQTFRDLQAAIRNEAEEQDATGDLADAE